MLKEGYSPSAKTHVERVGSDTLQVPLHVSIYGGDATVIKYTPISYELRQGIHDPHSLKLNT